MVTTLDTWYCEAVCSVIRFLVGQNVIQIEMHYQFIAVYDDGILRVQHVRKGCRELGNGLT